MTQQYASRTFIHFTFFISIFIAGDIVNSSINTKAPQVNSVLEGFSFIETKKGVTDTTLYTFFKTQTAFVNYYLDFALSRGGGGGGGDMMIGY